MFSVIFVVVLLCRSSVGWITCAGPLFVWFPRGGSLVGVLFFGYDLLIPLGSCFSFLDFTVGSN